MARSRLAPLALTLMALLAATGCATEGRSFNHTRVQTLEFGAMSSGVYQSVFGKPSQSEITTNADGKFENVSYMEANKTMGKIQFRGLKLEFRDEILNAWQYNSSFDDDRTVADLLLAAKIKKGVHEKKDVQALLGKPNGKARCPSRFAQNDCTGSSEVWAWVGVDISSTTKNVTTAGSDLIVHFDKSGIVTNVITHQSRTNPAVILRPLGHRRSPSMRC